MIHHVFANKSNIGDWLSARGIQKLLAPCRFEDYLCDEPFVEDTLDRLSKIPEGDFVIIGGGGLFMDYFVPFWEGFVALAERLTFGIWGTGYCDLKLEPTRPPFGLLSEVISRSRFCYVRDELTCRHLLPIPLSQPTGCPSVAVIERPTENGWGLLHVDSYTTAGADVFELMDKIGREFAERTGRPYRRTNNRISPESEKELQSTLDRYRKSDVILSSGLHGCVIGAAMGKKVLAVSGDWKIESFMAMLGWDEWVVDLSQAADVDDWLNRMLDKQPDPMDPVEKMRKKNQEVAGEILSLVTATEGTLECEPS